MPVDYRRINGPEDVIPYKLFTKLNTKSLKEKFDETIDTKGVRKDGRKISDFRQIYIKTGPVVHAKGSAYIEQGGTSVIVSVFDPREIPNRTEYSPNGELYCEFKFAPFSCSKRRLHQQDCQEKEYSTIMKKALEATVFRHEFPNFQVDIYALVLHNDGSALSAAITAAGVALAAAGIPTFDIITSATLAVQGENRILDPDLTEETLSEVQIEKEHGLIIMCSLSTHEQVSHFHQVGNLPVDIVIDSIDILQKACNDIVPLVQKCLVRSVLNGVSES